MNKPKEFKTLYVKSESLYYKENFEGKEINSDLVFENFKSQIVDLIEVQIKFIVFHNVLVSIYDEQKKNFDIATLNTLNACIKCSDFICENLSKLLAPVCETITKM